MKAKKVPAGPRGHGTMLVSMVEKNTSGNLKNMAINDPFIDIIIINYILYY